MLHIDLSHAWNSIITAARLTTTARDRPCSNCTSSLKVENTKAQLSISIFIFLSCVRNSDHDHVDSRGTQFCWSFPPVAIDMTYSITTTTRHQLQQVGG